MLNPVFEPWFYGLQRHSTLPEGNTGASQHRELNTETGEDETSPPPFPNPAENVSCNSQRCGTGDEPRASC